MHDDFNVSSQCVQIRVNVFVHYAVFMMTHGEIMLVVDILFTKHSKQQYKAKITFLL